MGMSSIEMPVTGESVGQEGLYMYCVIPASAVRPFGQVGLSDDNHGADVSTIVYRDIACVVSNSRVKAWDVSRENVLRHQRVNELALRGGAVLPIRFSTVAESRRQLVERFLADRYTELRERLTYFTDKQEYGLRVMWTDMKDVYAELLRETPELQAWRDRLAGLDRDKAYGGMILIGEEVQAALMRRRSALGSVLFDTLCPFSTESKQNRTIGDSMILNAAFLIASVSLRRFEDALDKLAEAYHDKLRFRFIGPTPPSNFIEIVVRWED